MPPPQPRVQLPLCVFHVGRADSVLPHRDLCLRQGPSCRAGRDRSLHGCSHSDGGDGAGVLARARSRGRLQGSARPLRRARLRQGLRLLAHGRVGEPDLGRLLSSPAQPVGGAGGRGEPAQEVSCRPRLLPRVSSGDHLHLVLRHPELLGVEVERSLDPGVVANYKRHAVLLHHLPLPEVQHDRHRALNPHQLPWPVLPHPHLERCWSPTKRVWDRLDALDGSEMIGDGQPHDASSQLEASQLGHAFHVEGDERVEDAWVADRSQLLPLLL
mmetsp:Transcript_24023/g.78155  ORF Transcript_24023/g.78155 Transcript_24023/m.78155 type:complete len:271 (-) Transcript_24023:992-1804(-)